MGKLLRWMRSKVLGIRSLVKKRHNDDDLACLKDTVLEGYINEGFRHSGLDSGLDNGHGDDQENGYGIRLDSGKNDEHIDGKGNGNGLDSGLHKGHGDNQGNGNGIRLESGKYNENDDGKGNGNGTMIFEEDGSTEEEGSIALSFFEEDDISIPTDPEEYYNPERDIYSSEPLTWILQKLSGLVVPQERKWNVVITNVITLSEVTVCLTENTAILSDLFRDMHSSYGHIDERNIAAEAPVISLMTPYAAYIQAGRETFWYRVLAEDVHFETDEVSCFFLDDGKKMKLPRYHLRQLHEEFLNMPFQAIRMHLFGFDDRPKLMTLDDLNSALVGKQVIAEIMERNGRGITARFLEISNDEEVDLNTKILESFKNSESLLEIPEDPLEELEESMMKFYEEVSEKDERNNFICSESLYAARLAHDDGVSWHRVIALKAYQEDNIVECYFLDFDIEMMMDFSDIRQLHKSFHHLPSQVNGEDLQSLVRSFTLQEASASKYE